MPICPHCVAAGVASATAVACVYRPALSLLKARLFNGVSRFVAPERNAIGE